MNRKNNYNRAFFNPKKLEEGVLYKTIIEDGAEKLRPFEGFIGGMPAFMQPESLASDSPIESFRGNINLNPEGVFLLGLEDYDIYLPNDKEVDYKVKSDLIKKAYGGIQNDSK